MEWQTIVAGALLLGIAVAIAFLLARLQEIKDRIIAALSLLAAIGLFILGAFFNPLPPDYVSLHQPWVEADLIVSDLQEGVPGAIAGKCTVRGDDRLAYCTFCCENSS